MRRTTRFFLLVCCLAFCCDERLCGQGTFQNLDFEEAMVVPISGDGIEPGPAFPGWTVYYGETSATYVLFNTLTGNGISTISLVTTNSPSSAFPLAGLYTAVLQSSTSPNDYDVSLAQTGMIPVGTSSLQFIGLDGPHPFAVKVNGQLLDLIILQDFGTIKEYGADISSFAGYTVELRFTQPHGITQWGNLALDDISFSPIGIPEPSTCALLILGGALFWSATRRRRK